LIAPVTFLVCERLAVPVVPYLIAEALASNIGGTATLVGDPPNIIIASRSGLTFNDFLSVLAPTSPLFWWCSSPCAVGCSGTRSGTSQRR
jgi:Na+/H+ antiporter NhaD/arsenite permease-like protein